MQSTFYTSSRYFIRIAHAIEKLMSAGIFVIDAMLLGNWIIEPTTLKVSHVAPHMLTPSADYWRRSMPMQIFDLNGHIYAIDDPN